jgi:hypothetical protein
MQKIIIKFIFSFHANHKIFFVIYTLNNIVSKFSSEPFNIHIGAIQSQ